MPGGSARLGKSWHRQQYHTCPQHWSPAWPGEAPSVLGLIGNDPSGSTRAHCLPARHPMDLSPSTQAISCPPLINKRGGQAARAASLVQVMMGVGKWQWPKKQVTEHHQGMQGLDQAPPWPIFFPLLPRTRSSDPLTGALQIEASGSLPPSSRGGAEQDRGCHTSHPLGPAPSCSPPSQPHTGNSGIWAPLPHPFPFNFS